MQKSPSLCSYPWAHLRLFRNNSYAPCCNYVGSIGTYDPEKTNLQEVLKGPAMEKLRSQMLRGEDIPGCRRCFEQETAGLVSNREQFNNNYPQAWKKPPSLRYIEFNFGTLCNLACRGCSPLSSDRWVAEEKKLGWSNYEPYKETLDLLNGSWDSIMHFKLIGGEPFMFKEHDEFIRRLAERPDVGQVTLEYNTNATVKVSSLVMETWNRMGHIDLAVSIDGLRERNDFFRHGSRWQHVVSNAKWFFSILKPQFTRKIHTIVNIYNVHELFELDEWLTQEFPEAQLSKQLVDEPEHMNIRNLPEKEKSKLVDIYLSWAKTPGLSDSRREFYQATARHLQLPANTPFSEFVRQDSILNRHWNYNLRDYNPVLADIVAESLTPR